MAAALDPPASPSERALRSRAWWGAAPPVVLGVVVALQLLDHDRDRGWVWVTTLIAGVVLGLLALVAVVVDLRAPGAWRRLPVDPGERLVWGTTAQIVRPTGGAGLTGVLALSTARLRWVPRASARLRGSRPEEWPLDAVGTVSVQPVDHRRRARGGRWVVLEIVGREPLSVVSTEAHLVADDLWKALAAVRSAEPDASAVR